VARRKFNEVIFGSDHQYGHFVTSQDYEKIDRTNLAAYHKRMYHSGNCTIIAAGKTGERTFNSLNKIFGGDAWKNGKGHEKKTEDGTTRSSQKIVVEKKDAV